MSAQGEENQQSHRAKRIKLSSLSDQEIANFMDSIDDDEFEDFDDSIEDPDYEYEEIIPDSIEDHDYRCDEIISEDCDMLPDYVKIFDSSLLKNAVNLSINASNSSLNTIGVDPVDTNPIQDGSTLEASDNASILQKQPETKTSFKAYKRPRSPLPIIEIAGPQAKPSSGGFTGRALSDITKDSLEFKNILWRKTSLQLHVNEVAFRGKTDLPSEVLKLKTPLQYFSYFFTDDLIDLISLETNRTALKENVNTQFKVDACGIRRYIGVLIFMSIFRYPNIQSHWSEYGFRHIPDCMSKNRFEQIKQYLSFNDDSERVQKGNLGYDPVFRIRKVAKHLVERFDSIPKNARLCVDEQMCSTKMVHHLRQYLPDKPHPWGVKFFVLCDTQGYSYRFEIYLGAKTDDIILPDTPDIGATGNVVIRLSQTVPNFRNHIMYFDNFYTSLPLMVYLRARGIYSLGTVRANRIPNCKLPMDKADELRKEPRGFSTEFVGSSYGVDMTTVLWKDTKNVRLCSTYVGIMPFQRSNVVNQPSKIGRYNRKKKIYDEIDCPQIIREYNAHMGGVDLMDSYMGRNGLKIKSQDMATRLFYHLLDMTITNAFVLYRRANAENNQNSNGNEYGKTMTMYEFRLSIAKELCASIERRSVGRPSFVENPTCSSIVGKKAIHPIDSVRFDKYNHFPEWGSKKSCKLCKKSDTHTFCSKCNVHLCFSKTKNCFKGYHMDT